MILDPFVISHSFTMATRKKSTKKQKRRRIVIRMPRGSRPIVQQEGRALPLALLAPVLGPMVGEVFGKLIKRRGIFP